MSETPAGAPAARYRVFISYNRGDAAIATALASRLTRFARPWYRTRAMRVFLDKTSLATAPTLGGAIDQALAASEWLVLIASPGSAASPWVQHEVGWWLARHGTARLVIVRVAGTIAWQGADGEDFDWSATTALAPQLRGRFATEPLWGDLADAAAAQASALSNEAFRKGFLGIAAQIHGVSVDALWSREQVEQRTRLAFAGLAAFTIGLLFWGLSRRNDVSDDRKENILSIQLGAKAFSSLPRDPMLAAQTALAGVAVRPSGIAASALRSAVARLAGELPPRFVRTVPGAVGLAFSPQASRLAVLARDGTVTLFDAATGAPAATLAAPAGTEARAIAWAAPGGLAVGDRAGLRLWPISDAQAEAVPPRASIALPRVRALAFSADGAQLALGLDDGSVHLVALAPAADVRRLAAPSGGAVLALAFSNDGRRLATGAADGRATLWRLADMAPMLGATMAAPIASLDFNREGSGTIATHMLAIADAGGAVQVVDADADAAATARRIDLRPGAGAAEGVAARFVQGRCLVQAGRAGPVVAQATLGFDPLFAFGAAAAAAPPRRAMAVGNPPGSSLFALLDEAGALAVYEAPLCGDAEAVCRFAAAWLREPMGAEARARMLPAGFDPRAPVSQPPGPVCRALIDRVLPR